jgi:hypothetical protein
MGYHFVRDIRGDEPYVGPGLVTQVELDEPDEEMERALASALGGTVVDFPEGFTSVSVQTVKALIAEWVAKRAAASQ